MQLTPEQLDKAARIAYETWYEGCRSWGESSENHKEDMRKAITAAFAAVDQAHGDVPGDLHKKAEMAAWEALGHGSGLVDSIQMMTIVGTVLRVAREDASCQLPPSPVVLMPDGTRLALKDARVLGQASSSEFKEFSHKDDWGVSCVYLSGLIQFLASRRARLLHPKTVEERVTISHQEGGKCFVCVDGEALVELLNSQYWIGDAVKDGLIAKLKAEGTVSREAGGNAQ